MTPQRIQRRRTKGWRMPESAVYVGRPTRWGNPYRVGGPLGIPGNCETAEEAVALFRERAKNWARNGWNAELLRGKDLVCWCPLDQPCHADVLLELANQPTGQAQD